jgi:hypothetical protein
MNLIISLHSIFQDEESLRQEKEVEAAGLEHNSDGEGHDSEEVEDDEEEGHEEDAGLYDEGVGVEGYFRGFFHWLSEANEN